MENEINQFMVDFTLPQNLTAEFANRIPQQRSIVNRLFGEGKLLNYSLSLENSKLWAVFSVDSEAELLELIYMLPLTRYMEFRISKLTFYNAAHPFTPAFSFN